MLASTGKIEEPVTHWRFRDVLPMEAPTFLRWQAMLEERIGIVLPAERKSFLLTTLAVRMRELGVDDYDEYFNLLAVRGQGTIEWETLVDRLTVHETRFYRDCAGLDLVRNAYLANMQAPAGRAVRVNAWSVGCATGEEPYSLAMMLHQYLGAREGEYYVGITATDISMASLATARRGVYHRNRLKNLPAELLREYFDPVDIDHYKVSEAIRERVCFTRLNLLELATAPVGKMDIIFCQNVLIYFKRELRIEILDHLAAHLLPGGLLVLGAGEVVGWRHAGLEPVSRGDVLAFRRLRGTS
ncbi:MAG: protein-glutamate O-methyltransferase CheR [Pseudomonadota bacterium]|nr:MAG: protein-glutamate O-methyltransferase CheR [Pseudomonadota bacterium]